MKLYFDSNVLSWIVERKDTDHLIAWLVERGHVPIVSSGHLTEALITPREKIRRARVEQLVRLAEIEGPLPPDGFIEAFEFILALGRVRPLQVDPDPDLRTAQWFMDRSAARWALARDDPSALSPDDRAYSAVFRAARSQSVAAQKGLQDSVREGAVRVDGVLLGDVWIEVGRMRLDDVSDRFRLDGLTLWARVLYSRDPGIRDLRDYAVPYLRRPIPPRDLADIWLREISEKTMPRALAATVVAVHQLRRTVGRGNSNDLQHALHVVDADVLITGDKRFFDSLLEIPAYVPSAARPVLIRHAGDLVRQIDEGMPKP